MSCTKCGSSQALLPTIAKTPCRSRYRVSHVRFRTNSNMNDAQDTLKPDSRRSSELAVSLVTPPGQRHDWNQMAVPPCVIVCLLAHEEVNSISG